MLQPNEVEYWIEQKQIPPAQQATFRKAHSGKSMRAGVNAFCQECQGNHSGCVKAIAQCEATHCPLWMYRPYRNRKRF